MEAIIHRYNYRTQCKIYHLIHLGLSSQKGVDRLLFQLAKKVPECYVYCTNGLTACMMKCVCVCGKLMQGSR